MKGRLSRIQQEIDHPHQATCALLRTTLLLSVAAALLVLTNVAVFVHTNETLARLSRTIGRYRDVKNDLRAVSASLFVMVQARAPLSPSERSLFRGYRFRRSPPCPACNDSPGNSFPTRPGMCGP